MTILEAGSVVVGRANLPATPVDDDLVLLDLATNNYVGFDAIGRRIWERIAEPIRVDTLCDDLATQFSGSADAIRSDVIAFLGELHGDGLIEIVKG